MARADTVAQRLLDSQGAIKLPVDPVKIAESLGVTVVYRDMTHDVSGMLIREGTRAVIGINQGHPLVRQRFTAAHELGHLSLHPGRPLILDAAVLINLRDQVSSLATDREEIEANRFAATLLMPEVQVRQALEQSKHIHPDTITQELARKFNVSDTAMTIRLTNLGLLRLT